MSPYLGNILNAMRTCLQKMVSAHLIKAIVVPWGENSHWILEGSHVVLTRCGGGGGGQDRFRKPSWPVSDCWSTGNRLWHLPFWHVEPRRILVFMHDDQRNFSKTLFPRWLKEELKTQSRVGNPEIIVGTKLKQASIMTLINPHNILWSVAKVEREIFCSNFTSFWQHAYRGL